MGFPVRLDLKPDYHSAAPSCDGQDWGERFQPCPYDYQHGYEHRGNGCVDMMECLVGKAVRETKQR